MQRHLVIYQGGSSTAVFVNSGSAIGIIYQGVFNRACFCKLCPRDWYELPSVVGVLCAVGRCVAGVVDGLRDGMVRLVGWDWIREALAGLPCD